MAIITILSGDYCHHDEIVTNLLHKLNYRQLNDTLIKQASAKYEVAEDKLVHSLNGTGPFRDYSTRDRKKLLAYLECVLAEMLQEDNALLSGCIGFLIPGNIAHVLRVCVIADIKYRIAEAVKQDNLTETAAQGQIKKSDQQLGACSFHLVAKSAFDESLYDIVLPMDKLSSEEAAGLIIEQALSDALKTTNWSQAQMQDFLLSSKVKVALFEAGHDVEVFAETGRVTVGINERALIMRRLEDKLTRIASEVEGVQEVATKLGSKFSPTSINPWETMDAQPKILLVDDEKEFVQTLSTRLKTRNLESSIAYDGEQALDMIEKDVPDVIVLDLLMPGIDGIETLRRVKESHSEVEVIILTGHGSDKEKEQAEDLGAFAYLRKPVNINELAQIMREAYMKRRRGR